MEDMHLLQTIIIAIGAVIIVAQSVATIFILTRMIAIINRVETAVHRMSDQHQALLTQILCRLTPMTGVFARGDEEKLVPPGETVKAND